MRNATVLVIRLRGVATETIKNIVLAGIGKLIVIDDALVQPEDVGVGFFFRDEDVSTKRRVDAAKPHIESLNPLVKVEVAHDLGILTNEEALNALLADVDLVCVTDLDQASAVSASLSVKTMAHSGDRYESITPHELLGRSSIVEGLSDCLVTSSVTSWNTNT
jgi:ubiquitin-like 1-activating enzyme E1 A